MLVLLLVRSGTQPGPWIPCESTNTGRGRPSGNTRHHPQPSIRRPSSGTADQFSHIFCKTVATTCATFIAHSTSVFPSSPATYEVSTVSWRPPYWPTTRPRQRWARSQSKGWPACVTMAVITSARRWLRSCTTRPRFRSGAIRANPISCGYATPAKTSSDYGGD